MCFIHDVALFILLVVCTKDGDFYDPEAVDYCIDDGFYAECPDGEVLMMQEATYGRMEHGRCLQYDIGLNCQSDVLRYMDTWCSAQQTCRVGLRIFFILTKECPAELNGYLRARYTCIPVFNIGEQCCRSLGDDVYVTINSGRIITMEQDASCQNAECAVIIQAHAGQQISISVYNFNSSASDPSIDIQGIDYRITECFAFVNIEEEGIGIRVTLCMADVRKRHIYTSSTNKVKIDIDIQGEYGALKYIIGAEAIGCPDPIPPTNGYLEREGDHATLKCYDLSDVMWEISCRDSEWHGQLGNCSQELFEDVILKENGTKMETHITPAMAIIVIVVFATCISAIIIFVGFMCIKRNRSSQNSITNRHSSPYRPRRNEMGTCHSVELLTPNCPSAARNHNIASSELIAHEQKRNSLPGIQGYYAKGELTTFMTGTKSCDIPGMAY